MTLAYRPKKLPYKYRDGYAPNHDSARTEVIICNRLERFEDDKEAFL